jgi:hypothetical protein
MIALPASPAQSDAALLVHRWGEGHGGSKLAQGASHSDRSTFARAAAGWIDRAMVDIIHSHLLSRCELRVSFYFAGCQLLE